MKEIPGKENEPSARLCPLGWTAIGRIDQAGQLEPSDTKFSRTFRAQIEETHHSVIGQRQTDGELNSTVKQFWDLESIGITTSNITEMTPIEKLAWKKAQSSLQFNGVRYEIAVPWKDDRPQLPNNLPMAEKRLKSVEQKLLRDSELARAYQGVIEEYLEKGYIRKVVQDESVSETEWFLPHFPVVRPEKTTTKVRVVFDGSATCEGKSLNTESLPGPKLQSNVFDILVGFRQELVVLVGDISQMYHQLVLLPEDRPLHRFLWRDLDQSKEPEVYEFLRFIFGGCYCPFCAQYAWQTHAETHKDEFPLAATAVQNHCYMDDLMPSLPTIKEAKETRQQLSKLGDKAGFHIRKWLSNRVEVLEDIPAVNRASEVDLNKCIFPVTKTLGVLWTATEDLFFFQCSLPPENFEYTKRNVLKKTAMIYDPLGLISPYIIRAKMLIQQAWLEAIEWDDPLPSYLETQWRQWFNEARGIEQVKIPRCLKLPEQFVTALTLHAFTDASEKAYAATVYSRHESPDGRVIVRLIASKTRLAPLKAISIPRLELMGAIIGLRLSRQICLVMNVLPRTVTFWVDSLNVICWIQGQSRDYKPFVANRVGEIHEYSSPDQWRYVSTKENPADRGTRGTSVWELASDELWWHGPQFLCDTEDKWPERRFSKTPDSSQELKTQVRVNKLEQCISRSEESVGESQSRTLMANEVDLVWRLEPTRYSKWYRINQPGKCEIGLSIVRVRSWVNRFIRNCKRTPENRETRELTPKELIISEEQIIKETQERAFTKEIAALKKSKPVPRSSPLLKLNPMLENGILRSNTRLRNAKEVSNEVKFPIILPKKNHITSLIVKYHHETEHHEMGVNFTINHLREKYFVVHTRQEVKRCVSSCAECSRRFRLRPTTQQMAPLPDIRLEMTGRPFENCATDYGGPYFTKQGRGKVRAKRYLCLFVCLQTHCCHLEMASSLDVSGFMNAFVRMTARRGWPKKMLSDNGTNFVSAEKEIRALVEQLDQKQIERATANKGITWHWNPPAAPHFGGVFESMIKSAKRAIAAVLPNADINDEELQTVFTGVESLLNSRPLTTISDDPNDELVLTPNHFLIGQMGGDIVPENVDTTVFNAKNRWRRIQELVRHVWRRWMKEYLPHLGSRKKWFLPTKNFNVGDVVVVIDPDAARREWKVGRIEQVYPGNDGLVRVIDVKVGGRVLRRPITRVSPLEM